MPLIQLCLFSVHLVLFGTFCPFAMLYFLILLVPIVLVDIVVLFLLYFLALCLYSNFSFFYFFPFVFCHSVSLYFCPMSFCPIVILSSCHFAFMFFYASVLFGRPGQSQGLINYFSQPVSQPFPPTIAR